MPIDATGPRSASRRWVHSLHGDDERPASDGICYRSRNNYPAACVALFERAAGKAAVLADIDLVDHAGWPGFVAAWRSGVVKGGV